MVSVPQDLVSMIVAKAVNMAKKLNINVLGVIENMSYITCAECGKRMKLFDGENTDILINDMGLKLLGELPMQNNIGNLAKYGDLYMNKIKGNMKSCLQPMAKILVSCRDYKGRNNALAVGYCCNCSYDPPMVMVGIVPSRYSYNIIKETGVFVVNLVTEEQKEMFDYLGSHSGRDEDKFFSN